MKFSDFGFKENPFSITPDPRYLYLSRGHEESLAHLIYGTGPNGGFVLLTGEVGTGKTLLIRSLLAQQLADVDIALVLNPRLSRREFLATICDELGVEYPGPPYSLKLLIDALSKHLLKTHGEGRHTVLVVDEAQNLSPRVLEMVRLLTNLETTRYKLLRIILVGQPELLQMLKQEELRQVDQRITARFHLLPINRQETANYILHRLAVAGIREDLFSSAALREVHRLSGGVPRMINTISERVLLAIFSSGKTLATPQMVRLAAKEVKGYRPPRPRWVWITAASLAGLVGLTAYLGAVWFVGDGAKDAAVAEEAPPPEPEVRKEIAAVEALQTPPEPETRPAMASPPPAGAPASSQPREAEPPAPATAAPISGDVLLARLFAKPQRQSAVFAGLYALWGESFNAASPLTPCMQAPARGLRCLKERDDWEMLRALNRPLLFRLVKERQSRFLLLKHIGSDGLLVVDDGESESVLEFSELKPYWRGEYVMLWRPHGGAALIGEGSSGEPVTWLRERMHQVDGEPVETSEGLDHFDARLKRRLQAFQRSRGLLDDGVAGQQTLVYLNNLALPSGTPTLRQDAPQGGS